MKIQVMLIVPAIGESYNVLLPETVKLRELLPMLIKGVTELSNNRYATSNEEFLCLDPLELPLDPEGTLPQFGVQNGDHLYLI